MHKIRWRLLASLTAVPLLALIGQTQEVLSLPRALNSLPPLGPPPPHIRPTPGGTITMGTPWTVVEGLLGPAEFSSLIPCLHRSRLVYPDGTEIILVNARVVSVSPGRAAIGDLSQGYVIHCRGCAIFIEPAVLRLPLAPELDLEMKCHVEQLYPFAPPSPVGYPAPPFPPMRPDPHEEYHKNDPTPWRRTHVY